MAEELRKEFDVANIDSPAKEFAVRAKILERVEHVLTGEKKLETVEDYINRDHEGIEEQISKLLNPIPRFMKEFEVSLCALLRVVSSCVCRRSSQSSSR